MIIDQMARNDWSPHSTRSFNGKTFISEKNVFNFLSLSRIFGKWFIENWFWMLNSNKTREQFLMVKRLGSVLCSIIYYCIMELDAIWFLVISFCEFLFDSYFNCTLVVRFTHFKFHKNDFPTFLLRTFSVFFPLFIFQSVSVRFSFKAEHRTLLELNIDSVTKQKRNVLWWFVNFIYGKLNNGYEADTCSTVYRLFYYNITTFLFSDFLLNRNPPTEWSNFVVSVRTHVIDWVFFTIYWWNF